MDALYLVIFLVVTLAVVVGFVLRSVRRNGAGPGDSSFSPPPSVTPDRADPPEPGSESRRRRDQAAKTTRIYQLVQDLETNYERIAHPIDLRELAPFRQGVTTLSSTSFEAKDRVRFAAGNNFLASCMALEAVRELGDEEAIAALEGRMADLAPGALFFALEIFRVHPTRGYLSSLLKNSPGWWPEDGYVQQFLASHFDEGSDFKLVPPPSEWSSQEIQSAETLLRCVGSDQTEAITQELARAKERHVNHELLQSIGRVWSASESSDFLVPHDRLNRFADLITRTVSDDERRSLVIVGDRGAGKTTLVRFLAKRLDNWSFFEARAADVLADQKYLGELEGRVRELADGLSVPRVIWFVPDLHELSEAGRHIHSKRSILDLILPFVERGAITVIGETEDAAYQKLLKRQPRLRSLFDIVRVEPVEDSVALELARQWARSQAASVTEATIQEAFRLAKQFLSDRVAPGNLLFLLKMTLNRVKQKVEKPSLERRDLLEMLAEVTGLPQAVLDDRQTLDPEEVKRFFGERVMGQAEAVDCLVERIALIKAGLTDPHRPLGVYLFTGPTGTGKTQLVKTMAEYLFGSPERMIRLDMSEFQSPDSSARLLGRSHEEEDGSTLIDEIRKQPFTVVLLDEFEKADTRIWDLFLQLFDDGRLTDKAGNTADFRHCVVIMTSNLGVSKHSALGFSAAAAGISVGGLQRALSDTFRPEFLNRIDRIVALRPLTRQIMRQILDKEAHEALQRRGLRTREWAIEMDDSATDFLLEKGFTSDLGARPLKRAIERYLLTPLALAMVDRKTPSGEQFLLLRSDGERIDVEFIDPDAPEETESRAVMSAQVQVEDITLKSMILSDRGDEAALTILSEHLSWLDSSLTEDGWRARKSRTLEDTQRTEFWNSEDRFSLLEELETIDRIEAGLKTAHSLLNRLRGSKSSRRTRFSGQLMQRLAEQLYLLGAAYESLKTDLPSELLLMVESVSDATGSQAESPGFALQIGNMYKAWARRRRMRSDILKEETLETDGRYRLIMSVFGFGAFLILRSENGYHVWETPKGAKSFHRDRVRVVVTPAPAEPDWNLSEPLKKALRALKEQSKQRTEIVRRYRAEPSPLVRDSVNQWRTGLLDRVLRGEFDLMS